jgi:hypothetical protein
MNTTTWPRVLNCDDDELLTLEKHIAHPEEILLSGGQIIDSDVAQRFRARLFTAVLRASLRRTNAL